MTIETTFELAQGSVIGRRHRQAGQNNQDAVHTLVTPGAMVAVVCDGCGSSIHSEVGSALLARLTATTLIHDVDAAISGQWSLIREHLLDQLHHILVTLDGCPSHHNAAALEILVRNYFLSTLVGVLITPGHTLLFSVGDGAFWLNGTEIILDKPVNNAPPYLAYGLLERLDRQAGNQHLAQRWAVASQVQVHYHGSTDQIQSLLLASDGISDFVAACDRPVPGRSDLVGPISQFWQHDAFFQNPDSVRRYLTLVNRDVTQPNWEKEQLDKHLGLLLDDTSLVVIRRKSGSL